MKKTINDPKNTLSSTFSQNGWSLCIGAGTSFPYFHMWDEFAKKIVLKCNPSLRGNEAFIDEKIKT